MSMDTSRLRSRRALLGAGLGAAAATAAAALPTVAKVSTRDVTGYLKVDNVNTGNGVTELQVGTGGLKVDNTHGRAIDAVSGDGTAVNANGGVGFALQTLGRLDLSTSGVATIPAGATSEVVYGGVDVTAGSFVLLTPALDIGSRRLWWTTDTVNNRFTIHLSSSRSTKTKVSWLLLG